MIRVRFAPRRPFPGWAKSDWFYNRKTSPRGGAMLDMGIHAIDLCLWLFGPVTTRSAPKPHAHQEDRGGRQRGGDARVQERRARLYRGRLDQQARASSGLEIYGTEGSLICDYTNGLQISAARPPPGRTASPTGRSSTRNPTTGGWPIEIGHWIDVVSGNAETHHGRQGRARRARSRLAAYKSSAAGKRVAIE